MSIDELNIIPLYFSLEIEAFADLQKKKKKKKNIIV